MANIFGQNVNLPEIKIFGGAGNVNWSVITFVVALILIGGVILYLIYERRIFNKKVIIFENISGQGFQPTIRDRARVIKIGDSGEELLFLKKKKLYRTAYGRKMGVNTYWFVKGQDGYDYNCVLGDFDAKMGMLDIEPIDRDVRMLSVAVRKNIQDRYRKQSIMDKYGGVIITGIFLIIVVVAILLYTKQMNKAMEQLAIAMEWASKVSEQNVRLLGMYDSLKTSGGLM